MVQVYLIPDPIIHTFYIIFKNLLFTIILETNILILETELLVRLLN